ncbi:NERD domain-containing protein [Arcobacter sp. FWKO B]|uniref:NERD domain-containing protein n=1 Tax=Arcobacter sp. FWKO B TaxID=2593672 RepID=UPI0018A345F6|nr:NERD domain-containing protein [Arcobacter sp. FWKO B]QOG12599.1 nuclease [Arcobacter sp. FWKO B]
MLDLSAVFSSVLANLVQVWYLIPLVLIILFFKSPFGKGLLGEMLVNFAVNVRLDKQIYHLIKNVTLPTENGTTQIDHIVVSEFGIFVIETKNMKGWIFGDEKQKTWSQKIYKHTSNFQNPLHQNYKHVKTIESALGIDHSKIFSVIVFVGDSTFKTKMPENVTYAGGFIGYIKSKTDKIILQAEVNQIVTAIESGRLSRTLKTHREHVKHVQNIVKEKENTNVCPKCGSELVLRVAKQGTNKGNEFYGCSNYPKCRHTAQVI